MSGLIACFVELSARARLWTLPRRAGLDRVMTAVVLAALWLTPWRLSAPARYNPAEVDFTRRLEGLCGELLASSPVVYASVDRRYLNHACVASDLQFAQASYPQICSEATRLRLRYLVLEAMQRCPGYDRRVALLPYGIQIVERAQQL